MTNDARTQFIDGLRVTADHLQHLQDRLRDSVHDLRQTIGVGKVAWGLRVTVVDRTLTVTPGVAFAMSGVRLNLDADASLSLPSATGSCRVTLKATEKDRASLRVGDKPTLIVLVTSLALEPANTPDPGPDALVIATVAEGEAGISVHQDPSLFAVAGTHSHSGEFRRDADGRWRYDGPNVAGEQGPRGDKGEPGEPGAKGDKGDVGEAGAKGDKGDVGEAGAKGDKGDVGEAGAKGDKGDVGEAGARGDKGDAGEAGAKGDKGDAGEAGARGDKGDAGEAGAKGDKGDVGEAGARGDKGDVGDAGVKGDRGDAGAKGDRGDAGAKGDRGDAGAKGDRGDAGPPGAGLDPNPTRISKISWPFGTTVDLPSAIKLMSRLSVILTDNLNAETLETQPQVVQVWFIPNRMSTIQSVHGSCKLEAQELNWATSDPAATLSSLFGQGGGGQILLRIHCGLLIDRKLRPVSAALDAVAPHANPAPVYGGVFETWFFVNGG